MRFFLIGIFMVSLVNCKTIGVKETLEKRIFKLENCAIDTQCSIEIIPNSNLLVKQDELQNSHLNIEEGEKTVVKYEFKRNELPNTADAHHSELIYFEIDKNNNQLFLTNEALQNVKMIYGRFCYCKDGTSGYFKVTQGRLKLSRNDNELSIDFNFKVGKIPQLLTEIKETIKLK